MQEAAAASLSLSVCLRCRRCLSRLYTMARPRAEEGKNGRGIVGRAVERQNRRKRAEIEFSHHKSSEGETAAEAVAVAPEGRVCVVVRVRASKVSSSENRMTLFARTGDLLLLLRSSPSLLCQSRDAGSDKRAPFLPSSVPSVLPSLGLENRTECRPDWSVR